ncbi:hypothetical protein ABYF34_06170 [Buchananella felis]|uniref:hypothetical protein n=1 Tax=Buchananella felis TaxID=3231492 RepID=UPI003528C3B0
MDPLAESLAWRTVDFVEAAERVSWPLPLSGPSHTLTRRTATSPALNPADFGLISQGQFDATGLIAYGIDLRASMEAFPEAAYADEDQILTSLEIAYDLFSSEFGTPRICPGLEEGTGYYWWQRPSGLRLHLCFTAEATSELWVARPAEQETPQATPASTVWDHIDALVATDAAESQYNLALLARERGWTVLSDSYKFFYLGRGADGPAQLSESHPLGIPDYATICGPPEVAVVAGLPGTNRVTTTFPAVAEPEALIAQVCSRYGAGRGEQTGGETKYTWDLDQGKTLIVRLRGSEVTVGVFVSRPSVTRAEVMQEDASVALAFIEQIREKSTAITAADIDEFARVHGWVKVERAWATEDVFFTRQGCEGRPGVVVTYRDGVVVERVYFQTLPRGIPASHVDDVHTALPELLGQLDARFDSVGKQTSPAELLAEGYRGKAAARGAGDYRFLAQNGSAWESGPINAQGKTPLGFKALVFVLGVLTVILIAALLT